MRIVDIRERSIKLDVAIRNAAFSFDDMTTSIVAVITDVKRDGKPVVGYAFNSTGRYACGAQVRDRFAPRILRQPPSGLIDESYANFDADKIVEAMMFGEKAGGDMERSIAIGTIEVALWDAMAKIENKPLSRLIAERFGDGNVVDKMFCYVGGGWYTPGETESRLQDEMRGHLDDGYTMVKSKVGGLPVGEDRARIEAILSVLDDPSQLAVDANGGLSPDRSLEYASGFKDLGLRWFEEPVHPLDYQATGAFVEAYELPVATGENLFALEDQRNLLRHGGVRRDTDIIQIDVPQSYGISACAKSLAMLSEHGWSPRSVIPHGGNLMSLAVALGFGMGMCEAYPKVFGVFSGYGDDSTVENGYLSAPDLPGIGFESQHDLYSLFRTLID